MQLNLPILHLFKDAKRILIAGAGGGFDIYAGLPLYFTLREHGKTVHLANLTFTDFKTAKKLSEHVYPVVETLVMGVGGKVNGELPYYPEGYLTQWFKETHGEDITMWMFERRGIQTMVMMYQELIKHLGGVDAVILVDGGVDALMRGDEQGPGTMLEDSISLGAIEPLDVPIKILANVGFGTEVEEAVCHHHALENMAALIADGGFYGACALTPQMDAFQQFDAACRYVWEQPGHHKSHISTRIIPAVHGEFGNVHMYSGFYQSELFISPLMALYWFFDANAVIRRNQLIAPLRDTITFEDAYQLNLKLRVQNKSLRPRKKIPY